MTVSRRRRLHWRSKVPSLENEGAFIAPRRYLHKNRGQIGRLTMKTDSSNLIPFRMKQLEEMSREELIEEIISNSKHLKEIEAARKESEHRRTELEKQVELLEKAQESISKGEPEMGKAIPYLQELLNMKDKKIAKLQKEIDAAEKESQS